MSNEEDDLEGVLAAPVYIFNATYFSRPFLGCCHFFQLE
jgi:hypothetical protein